jgi:hypothetical protein
VAVLWSPEAVLVMPVAVLKPPVAAPRRRWCCP